jgi:hypothetical protein
LCGHAHTTYQRAYDKAALCSEPEVDCCHIEIAFPVSKYSLGFGGKAKGWVADWAQMYENLMNMNLKSLMVRYIRSIWVDTAFRLSVSGFSG